MSIDYQKEKDGIVTLCFDNKERGANVLNQEFVSVFKGAVVKLAEEENLQGVILTSAKSDFIAGADLEMMIRADEAAKTSEWIEDFKGQLRKLETLGVPVVAAINGSALGGGYEVALACHHRVCLNNPKIWLGLPEVTLGLLPGAGGTQRLPRIIGIEQSLPLLLEGKKLKPDQALKAGLIDALAENEDELIQKAVAFIKENPEATQPWDQKGFRWPGGSPSSPKLAQVWAIAPSMTSKKTWGKYEAPTKILSCVHEGSQMDMDSALRMETRYLVSCITSQQAKNMINTFWFQLNSINKGEQRPDGIEPKAVKKVGILGAGMMGSGIAYVSAKAGIEVVLKDVSLDAAKKGKSYSESLLDKAIERNRSTPEKKEALLSLITPTQDVADLEGCDLVIEAVFEDRDLKATVTKETEAVLDPAAVFASNTSTLPISSLAKASRSEEKFIGLHFFSPVDKMKLVEIIMGEKTSKETLARAFDYVLQIAKTPIVVNDSRGFYTSRVFTTYVLEGLALLGEGAHPRRVEVAGLDAGMPVGPLALSDEVSIELMYKILMATKKDLEASGAKLPDHPGHKVVFHMIEELNRLGKKNNEGFYEYPEKGSKSLWTGLAEHFPVSEDQLSRDEMMDRMLYIQSLETVRCMEEGVITSASDANIGSIFGWGFAPFHGGTLQYINAVGLKKFATRAKELASKYGERFEPPKLLIEMAEKGELFR